ncbi:MAG: ATP-binding protein, partial [Bacteroidales bacterium]|nr:ATP-binding protein [Bacteroidales bacterium]
DNMISEIGINQDNYGKILVSTLEAVNNAIVHGNKSDLNKLVKIDITFRNNMLKVTVTDEGRGFKPAEVPDPTKPENIENITGRGVFLMSNLADSIKFNKKGNSVTMTFQNIISKNGKEK